MKCQESNANKIKTLIKHIIILVSGNSNDKKIFILYFHLAKVQMKLSNASNNAGLGE